MALATDIPNIMFLVACALWLPLKPIDFPSAPIGREVGRGMAIFGKGRGLDRLFQEDRQVVGTWFDGRRHVEADHVIWISPSLVSRWLGYLEAREKWQEGELVTRWTQIRRQLAGRLTFIVRLCALPKVDLVEQEFVTRGRPEDARSVRFLWTASSNDWPEAPIREGFLGWSRGSESSPTSRPQVALRAEPEVCLVEQRQTREPSRLFKQDWWLRIPFGEPLTPWPGGAVEPPGLPLGDSYGSTFLVQTPIPDGGLPRGAFELRAFSSQKERVARFSLFPERGALRR